MAEILLMEPDARLSAKMCEVLSHAGHSCLAAQTVPEGLALVNRSQRLLTVLNARLPWKDSFSFLHTLEERGWPVLFITGDKANSEHLRAMYQAGCDVLPSPFDARALVQAVG